MGVDRFGLFRPIEITSASKDLIVNEVAKSITTGVYACLPNLLWELSDVSGVTFSLDASDNYKVKISDSSTVTVTWTDTLLRDILGFSQGNLSTASSYTADDYPRFSFVPTNARSDQNFFELPFNTLSPGVTSASGELLAVASTPLQRELSIDIPIETAARVSPEFGTSDYDVYSNWETFIHGARTSQPTSASNPSVKGVYFFPDVDDAVSGIQSMDSGGLTFDYASSPDTYVFTHIMGGTVAQPSVALPTSRMYYNLSLRVVTATAPTWVTLS